MSKNKKNKPEFNDRIFTRREVHEFPNGTPEKFTTIGGASVHYVELPNNLFLFIGIIIGLIIGAGMTTSLFFLFK